jgi:hypothetical protein
MAWRSEAREEFEVKDARSAPPPAAARRAVLEFEFLSRKMAPKQSTDESPARRHRKGSHVRTGDISAPDFALHSALISLDPVHDAENLTFADGVVGLDPL